MHRHHTVRSFHTHFHNSECGVKCELIFTLDTDTMCQILMVLSMHCICYSQYSFIFHLYSSISPPLSQLPWVWFYNIQTTSLLTKTCIIYASTEDHKQQLIAHKMQPGFKPHILTHTHLPTQDLFFIQLSACLCNLKQLRDRQSAVKMGCEIWPP